MTALNLVELDAQDRTSIEKCHRANHPEWGAPLPADLYLKREQVLASQRFAQCLHYWATTRYDSDDTSFISHCETYHRRLRVYFKCENDRVDYISGKCAGVASVFVPPEHRGNRYAQQMMQQLRDRFMREDKDMLASALYSDVGPYFYSKPELDWRAYTSLHLRVDKDAEWPHSDASVPMVAKTISSMQEWKPLMDTFMSSHLPTLVARHFETHPNSLAFIQEPSVDGFQWFKARGDFYANFYQIPQEYRSILGCKLCLPGSEGDAETSWMIYFWDWRWKTLYILQHHIASPVHASPLIRLMKEHLDKTKQWIDYAVIWSPSPLLAMAFGCSNPPSISSKSIGAESWTQWIKERQSQSKEEQSIVPVMKVAKGIQYEMRLVDSIPSLAVFSSNLKLKLEEKGRYLGSEQEVDAHWLLNEKYGWV